MTDWNKPILISFNTLKNTGCSLHVRCSEHYGYVCIIVICWNMHCSYT